MIGYPSSLIVQSTRGIRPSRTMHTTRGTITVISARSGWSLHRDDARKSTQNRNRRVKRHRYTPPLALGRSSIHSSKRSTEVRQRFSAPICNLPRLYSMIGKGISTHQGQRFTALDFPDPRALLTNVPFWLSYIFQYLHNGYARRTKRSRKGQGHGADAFDGGVAMPRRTPVRRG